MNPINWFRQPVILWSFSMGSSDFSERFFEAHNLDDAQDLVMNEFIKRDLVKENLYWQLGFGQDYWELVDDSGETHGILKSINDRIVSVEKVIDDGIKDLQEREEARKKRDEMFRKMLDKEWERNPRDPEDYYGYSRRPRYEPFEE
tara:strand:- start:125 stop:562 length:438 start_codon:yes stop_codon:yes gene_type:complete